MTTKQQIRTMRQRAITVGGRTLDLDEERAALPVDLLATAVGGLPDLAAAAVIGLDLTAGSVPGEAVRRAQQELRQGACKTVRLCQRALENDARNGDYDWRPWVDIAVTDTSILIDHSCQTEPEYRESLDHVAALSRALGAATVGLTYDRMSVPEMLCTAQTHALVLVLAAEARLRIGLG